MPRLVKTGLRFLLILALVAAPLLALAALFVREAEHAAVRQESRRTVAVARLGAYAVHEHIRGLVEFCQAYALRPSVSAHARTRDASGARAVLEEMISTNRRLDRVFLTDAKGIEWADYPHDPSVIGKDFSHRDWYRGVTSSGETFVSGAYLRAAAPQRLLIAVAVPIQEDGRLVAILVGQTLMTSVEDALSRAVGPWDGSLVVIDRAGKLSATAQSAHEAGDDALVREASLQLEGGVIENGNMSWVAGASMIPSMAGRVAAFRERDKAIQGSLTLGTQMFGFVILLSLVLSLLAHMVLETRRRKLEFLEAEERKAKELSQRKSDYVAYLAHEIRSPLSSIHGFTDLILNDMEGPISQGIRDDLLIVQERVQHILKLVNDLLDTSKIEAGRFETNPDVFLLDAVVEKVLTTMAPMGRSKNLQLRLAGRSELKVKADPRLVEQALTNLVGNALKFTQVGEVVVSISRDGAAARVEVKDNGPGMSADDLRRVFERYASLNAPRSVIQKDTGLGLYLSRQLIELQGGKLWLESEPGQGTRGIFTLPIAG